MAADRNSGRTLRFSDRPAHHCHLCDVYVQAGMASHVYVANASMDRKYFYNADGELLLVPQENLIHVLTNAG